MKTKHKKEVYQEEEVFGTV